MATYVLPAGEFERDGRQVIPGTYHTVEADPLPLHTFLTAIPAGLAAAQDIIFFVFVVGGVIAVVRATGSIDALVGAAIRHLSHRPAALMFGTVVLFAVGSSTIGMAEEYMPFVPILVTMCLAMRMDAVVAVGIIYIGAGVGYACAAINPFTVLIAQADRRGRTGVRTRLQVGTVAGLRVDWRGPSREIRPSCAARPDRKSGSPMSTIP